jgi:hypothetical protein
MLVGGTGPCFDKAIRSITLKKNKVSFICDETREINLLKLYLQTKRRVEWLLAAGNRQNLYVCITCLLITKELPNRS